MRTGVTIHPLGICAVYINLIRFLYVIVSIILTTLIGGYVRKPTRYPAGYVPTVRVRVCTVHIVYRIKKEEKNDGVVPGTMCGEWEYYVPIQE